jgi:hypothetical protein
MIKYLKPPFSVIENNFQTSSKALSLRLFSISLISLFITVSKATFAIDRNGDFTVRNFFPTKDEYALSSWKVVTTHLNCRKQPGKTHRIVRVFHQGAALTAQTSEGSHDNVGFLQMDAQGKPWMWVYINYNKSLKACFVRANRAYIAPMVEKN